MLSHLITKELKHYLLDVRFVLVLVLASVLSLLGVRSGLQNYAIQLREHDAVRKVYDERLGGTIERGNLNNLMWIGYSWTRSPSVLSPVVYGLDGVTGQQVHVRYHHPAIFEGSAAETDPMHARFGVLDLSVVVKVLLSLVALLFVHDAVSGEKEAGTLRLYSSFSVPRSRIAMAKLIGVTVAVLIPLVLSFLLACVQFSLSPKLQLGVEDWGRVALLVTVFALYLSVFIAFGLAVSALTHRKATALLALLVLWVVWLFVVPNVGVWAANRMAPVTGIYDVILQDAQKRWAAKKKVTDAWEAYLTHTPEPSESGATEAEWERFLEGLLEARYHAEISADGEYYQAIRAIQTQRLNQSIRRRAITQIFSSVSPAGAADLIAADLARTGPVQQEQIERALNAYLPVMATYISNKKRTAIRGTYGGVDLSDAPLFDYQDRDTIPDVLVRNRLGILNLLLLAVVGFACAYVAILRYDVR